MANFFHERRLGRLAAGRGVPVRVIGLDESGRGPLAGPVLAAAVWLDPGRCSRALVRDLDDCKVLAPEVRRRLYERLQNCAAAGRAAIAIGQASVIEIDTRNILRASLLAMARAAAALQRQTGMLPDAALVDGIHLPELDCRAEALVEGDRLSACIAAASIVAKVTRDRIMEELSCVHPGYGWEHNRGYGTPDHQAALRRLGATPEHRRSFAPVREVLGLSL